MQRGSGGPNAWEVAWKAGPVSRRADGSGFARERRNRGSVSAGRVYSAATAYTESVVGATCE